MATIVTYGRDGSRTESELVSKTELVQRPKGRSVQLVNGDKFEVSGTEYWPGLEKAVRRMQRPRRVSLRNCTKNWRPSLRGWVG